MIKMEFTKNNVGINITGDYDDLNFLYDSIHFFIKDEPNNLMEESMQNHLFGFLYDVRHCYQGDRDFKIKDNELRKEIREFRKVSKKEVTDNNLYYSFNYVLTDIFTDMVLIKYFVLKISKSENNIYNIHLNNMRLFYSQVLELMNTILTPIKMKKLKKGLTDAMIIDKFFVPQWFDMITCDFLKQSKVNRIKELSKTLFEIYNYGYFDDYTKIKKEIEEYCKENNCKFTDVTMCEYPKEIEW